MAAVRTFREPLSLADTLLELTRARCMLGQREEAVRSFEEADAIIDGMADPGYLATDSTGARAGALRTVASARRTTVRSRTGCPAPVRRRPLQA